MLGKITIDNSVIYVSKDDQTHSEQSSPNSKERKNASNIKLSRNIEKKPLKTEQDKDSEYLNEQRHITFN